jgi:antitoxin component of MazEF toxin-antitoxin module
MRVFLRRKLIKIGDSVGIIIPADIIKTYEMEAGDPITFIADVTYEGKILAIDIEGRHGSELHQYLDDN